MPNLYIIGGANGAGKTTAALKLLPEFLSCYEYVNADSIAAGLSPFKPESVALQAGRLMLERLQTLAGSGVDFAFESTLASHPLSVLERCRREAYTIHLLYIWLRSPELAVQRVAQRVRSGGHAVPEATIRRRYEAGRKNLVTLYTPLADDWMVYDNSGDELVLVAEGGRNEESIIHNLECWEDIIG
jgi:predicted ABC-type ATPase